MGNLHWRINTHIHINVWCCGRISLRVAMCYGILYYIYIGFQKGCTK